MVSVVLVLDLLESSDGLSGDLAFSVASPSTGGGRKSGVNLLVQLAVIILGEDGDLITFVDDFSVTFSSGSVTVGLSDLVDPAMDLGDVSDVLGIFIVKSFQAKSLEKHL